MLHPQRLARILEQYVRDKDHFSLYKYFDLIRRDIDNLETKGQYQKEIKRIVEKQFYTHIMRLAGDKSIHQQVSAQAISLLQVRKGKQMKENSLIISEAGVAHDEYLSLMIDQFFDHPETYSWPKEKEMPPGSPIGCFHE